MPRIHLDPFQNIVAVNWVGFKYVSISVGYKRTIERFEYGTTDLPFNLAPGDTYTGNEMSSIRYELLPFSADSGFGFKANSWRSISNVTLNGLPTDETVDPGGRFAGSVGVSVVGGRVSVGGIHTLVPTEGEERLPHIPLTSVVPVAFHKQTTISMYQKAHAVVSEPNFSDEDFRYAQTVNDDINDLTYPNAGQAGLFTVDLTAARVAFRGRNYGVVGSRIRTENGPIYLLLERQ